MSANNLILVKEISKGFTISMRDAETGIQLGKEEKFTSRYHNPLYRALLRAQEIVDQECVEYGIRFEKRRV